ncbi:hypothetical protein [Parasitella parasitica]|uniref:Uncharacterized protein n=1 Tax=Parasitella parasitica TaxID=35722 RepID=A0A0B7N431_9FUNG|nr:hypothetical protein [Parasitella parasitica]
MSQIQVFAASISNNSNSNGTRNNAAIAAAIFIFPTPIQVPTISPVRPASAIVAPMPLPRSFLPSEQPISRAKCKKKAKSKRNLDTILS